MTIDLYALRIVIKFHNFNLEPVGSSAPKFSSTSAILGSFSVKIDFSHSLSCPAQGFPMPAYR